MLAALDNLWPHCLRRLSARGWLLLAGAILIAGSILLSALMIWRLRIDAIADARNDSYSLGVVIAEQTERSMQAIDLVLQQERATIFGAGVDSPHEFDEVFSTHWAHDTLVRQLASVPQAEAIVLVSADGLVVNSTRGWPAEHIDISDLAHFQYQRAHEDAGLYISEPVLNRSTGTPTIYLSRRLSGRGGEYLGIIQAAVRIKSFDDLYQAVALSNGHGITLLRQDGVVITRYPVPPGGLSLRMPAQSPWFETVKSGGGAYRSTGWLGNETQFVSVHPLRTYPVVIDSTLSEDAAFSVWRSEVMLLVIETVAGVMCILLLTRALIRKFDHLDKTRAALHEKSNLLEMTLEHMDQGLMMVTPERHVGVFNAKVLELLELPRALMEQEPGFADLVAWQAQTGEFAADAVALADIGKFTDLSTHPFCYERQRANGRQLEVRTVPISSGGFVRTYTDITERRAAEERIRYLAQHDDLTGLANRSMLRDCLSRELQAGRRDRCTAVLCLDLNDFKSVNDTMGHAAGDALLRLVAARLIATVRQGDVVARLGGDEFAIVQTDITGPAEAHALAQRLAEGFAIPFEFESHRVPIGISVGIAIGPADGVDADTLLKNADIALYRAKDDTQICYRFFEPAMDIEVQRRRALELDLRQALDYGEFELYFQPILHTRTRMLKGFEALLRWRHPKRGLVLPGEFIGLAEEVGLIVSIGEWAAREACRRAASWPVAASVAINLSAVQVRSGGLVEMIRAALADSGLEPARLELEITESVLLHDTAATLQTLHELRSLGLRIALDDFGTGYSSLGYLRSFPFDQLKIDRMFVQELHAGAESLSIIRAILALGSGLGMAITAEGVETEAQFTLLQAEECSHVQGFLFGRPQPADSIPALLERFAAETRLAA